MSDYVDEQDDNAPIRVNFSDVPGKKVFYLLPPGKYIAEVTDFSKSFVSEESDNSGAPIINWEFTIESTVNGDTEIEGARVRNPDTKQAETADIKVEGRRVWDNMTIVESSFWRMRDLLDACWFDTSGELEIYPQAVVGCRLILDLTAQPAKKDRKPPYREYKGRNKINNFLPLDEERPADEPKPEPAKAVKEEKAAKAKETKDKEESPV